MDHAIPNMNCFYNEFFFSWISFLRSLASLPMLPKAFLALAAAAFTDLLSKDSDYFM